MLDDLRRSASDDFEDEFDGGDDDGGYGNDAVIDAGGGLFLGMTAVERMFISIFLFLNVCVLGFGLLLVSGRIQF